MQWIKDVHILIVLVIPALLFIIGIFYHVQYVLPNLVKRMDRIDQVIEDCQLSCEADKKASANNVCRKIDELKTALKNDEKIVQNLQVDFAEVKTMVKFIATKQGYIGNNNA